MTELDDLIAHQEESVKILSGRVETTGEQKILEINQAILARLVSLRDDQKELPGEPETPPDGWPINPYTRQWMRYAFKLRAIAVADRANWKAAEQNVSDLMAEVAQTGALLMKAESRVSELSARCELITKAYEELSNNAAMDDMEIDRLQSRVRELEAEREAMLAKLRDPYVLARSFHRIYESLAPEFGYVTREDTRELNPDTPNGRLMIATCKELVRVLLADVGLTAAMGGGVMTKQQKMAMERRDLAIALTSIQGRLINANLPITARAIHGAVRAIGWEMAGDTKKAAEYAK